MSASFEVERLEWVAPDRLEVAGRWFGVRGLRFVRPSLDLEAGDERRHLLAVLDHKPWEAHDGEEWIAAFPWDGEKVELSRAELAVTPAVIVELPVDGSSGTSRASRPAKPKQEPKPKSKPAAPARRVEKDAPETRAREEAQALRQERDAALAARDEAATQRDAATAERDAATAERDAATAERDAAKREHAELAQARDAAEAARADAVTKLEAAAASREAARAERDRATQSLKDALDREKKASAARDQALRERDEAQSARDELSRKHTATLAATELSAAPSLELSGESSPWRVRAIALGALLLLLAIAAAVVQGVL